MKRLLLTIFLAPIRLYQRLISPALRRRCKYEPTCSAYAVEAIRQLGVVRGSIVAAWRRDNPAFPNYEAGTWGPVAADELMRRDGREWRRR